MNVGKWLNRWASLRPNKTALLFEGSSFTYRQLSERVNRFIHLLCRMEIRKGDRVAVLLYNSNAYIEAFFALSTLGVILVPLNWRLTGTEMGFILEDSGSETLMFGEDFAEQVASIRATGRVEVKHYICVGEAIPSWAVDYEEEIGREVPSSVEADEPSGGEDPQIIMYTSGTTGLPKGAVLSHRKTFFNVLNADLYYGLTSDDIFLVSRALFHSGGLLVEAAPMLYKGGTIILRKRFRPQEILEAIERYRVTVLEAPATLYHFILQQCDLKQYDLGSLRCCFTGGERVSPSLLEAYQEKGIPLSQIYGQTETSTITWLPCHEARRKLGSVGIPVFHGDVRIINKDGRDVSPGEVGEIIVAGPILMTGYWERPQQTAEAIRGGWLHTGDLAKRDEEGFIYIVDREKDMFISGGENVYPAEIEKVYLQNPKISDVAVVGIPDAQWGEAGMVFIVLKEGEGMTEEEALDFCKGKIARYKIPKYSKFVTELPMTAAQKIKRHQLREDYLREKG